ncbi:hypothetical protein ES703_73882 [subsurface metagenome]
MDFKPQPTGLLTRYAREIVDGFVGLDKHYNIVDTFLCQNGYFTDEHDIQLTSEGHVILIALDIQAVDMSALVPGGKPNALVMGNHVQEIDQNNNVVFEWRSWDRLEITDAVHENLTLYLIDYVHMNSVAVDYDGHIVISSRHLNECTKINRQTGDIIWRLGGENNQFNFINDDDRISYQHDFRPVPGVPGNYTMMDNGNFHQLKYSRGVEFSLDTDNMIAEKVWEYRNAPNDFFAQWMGSVQRLPNGNTLINWADQLLPKATEVTQAGDVVYEADFINSTVCYRTSRFEWDGMLTEPYLVAEAYPAWITLIFNKFGDDDVKHYNVYGGKSPQPTDLITQTANTWINLSALDNNATYYFRVTSVSNSDVESDYSNTEQLYVNFTEPGGNFILNGDFNEGDTHWDLGIDEDADATGNVNGEGYYHFNISNGGSEPSHIQLQQGNLPLQNGLEYKFEFDAYSVSARIIEAKITRATDPFINYGQIGPTFIAFRENHYIYVFTMEDPSDLEARVVINCGNDAGDVYIDNLSLTQTGISGLDEVELSEDTRRMYCTYNSMDQFLSIYYYLSEPGDIFVEIYSILGVKQYESSMGRKDIGKHNELISLPVKTPGTYICVIRNSSTTHNYPNAWTLKFNVAEIP